MIRKAAAFLKEVRSELTQVSWATPRELWDSTKMVLVTAGFLSLVIGLIDLVCARFMSWMIR